MFIKHDFWPKIVMMHVSEGAVPGAEPVTSPVHRASPGLTTGGHRPSSARWGLPARVRGSSFESRWSVAAGRQAGRRHV